VHSFGIDRTNKKYRMVKGLFFGKRIMIFSVQLLMWAKQTGFNMKEGWVEYFPSIKRKKLRATRRAVG
jgi:hypothetical protein